MAPYPRYTREDLELLLETLRRDETRSLGFLHSTALAHSDITSVGHLIRLAIKDAKRSGFEMDRFMNNLKKFLVRPIEEVPQYINDSMVSIRTLAKWRLQIGK